MAKKKPKATLMKVIKNMTPQKLDKELDRLSRARNNLEAEMRKIEAEQRRRDKPKFEKKLLGKVFQCDETEFFIPKRLDRDIRCAYGPRLHVSTNGFFFEEEAMVPVQWIEDNLSGKAIQVSGEMAMKVISHFADEARKPFSEALFGE